VTAAHLMLSKNRQIAGERRSLLRLAAMALIVGAATGCLGAVFRLSLEHADRLRDAMIAWAHGHAIWGSLIVSNAAERLQSRRFEVGVPENAHQEPAIPHRPSVAMKTTVPELLHLDHGSFERGRHHLDIAQHRKALTD
jgi:hypothetical protein